MRTNSAPLYRKPRTEIEIKITEIWIKFLKIPNIGLDDNFFEMGANSLLIEQVASQLNQLFNIIDSSVRIYQHPTVASLSEELSQIKIESTAANSSTIKKIKKSNKKNKKSHGDIAIIGMAVRFPGASTINELWEVLRDGIETISFFKSEELDASIPDYVKNDPQYVKARGIVPSAKTFDAIFFEINQKLAEVMDPQIRLFLEIAWEVLEENGYLNEHYKGTVGVYAGNGANSYYKDNILTNKELMDQVGPSLVRTVNEEFIATRTAYHLNLNGPAVSVQSACSTSLLAICQAVEAIRNGHCDVAIAGASSVTAPIHSGHLYQEGAIFSPDGHCRAFGSEAKGTVFSDGAGVVLLKSLDLAKKDGDFIHAVIKGVGINNDGGNKGSFTAPSSEQQAGAISKAFQDAKIKPSKISYVEAHGTATPVGDPIEMKGLNLAFGEQKKLGYCAVGSIKSNLGHLTAAAGVAGLIKTILAMKHKQIPASLGFKSANPTIDFKNSPFYVNKELNNWEVEGPRIAGVSSFGVGGTNVHVILEEYNIEEKESKPGRPLQILSWSAKTQSSLSGYEVAFGDFLQSSTKTNLADIAYSLSTTRASFNNRSFIIAKNIAEAAKNIIDENKKIKKATVKVAPNEIGFLFPGQGSQFLQMGKTLYDNETVFRDSVDLCAELLMDDLKLDIRNIIYPEINTNKAEESLKDTRLTQPALFVTEYALSQLWISWGIKPTLLCGHSIGEFVAAHLAGVFNLKDTLHLIATRGRLVSELPRGSMLSVRLPEERIKELLPKTLTIAAVNSKHLCVVAGQDQDIEDFAKLIESKEIPNRILITSHAFHSAMMDPILETFEKEVEKTKRHVPNIPIVSTVTGTWMTESEATSTSYWVNHLRNTVRFADAMETVLKLDNPILLEVGPGKALTTLAHQQGHGAAVSVFPSLVFTKEEDNEYESLLDSLGELWLRGINPDWKAFYGSQERQKISLPSYVFDRKHCWIDPPSFQIKNLSPDIIETQSLSSDHDDTIIKNIMMRKTTILSQIYSIVSQTSGIDSPNQDPTLSFLNLGLDSLALTQLAIQLKKHFKLPISFRQLNEEFGSPALLADYLDQSLPQDEQSKTIPTQTVSNTNSGAAPMVNKVTPPLNDQSNTAFGLIAQQLQFLGKQLELLQVNNGLHSNEVVPETVQKKEANITGKNLAEDLRTPEEIAEHQKPFGASPKIEKQANTMSFSQKEFLEELIDSYTKKTSASKSYAQKNRSIMADPRVVSGFKPLTKEIVYPLVVEKSSGNRLWDIDGNVYIDVLNGFGSCFFGHQPDFIKEALYKQIEKGFEVGPQHPLAGEVCELLCEFTKQDRAALCNTGSEAILGTMRIARTVTGRSLIVAFSGSYHGITDEVIVRGSKKLMTFPAAAGIMPESVQNMLILEYGSEESLRIIAERAHELAAVLVEPIQSRRPEFQPIDFLHKLRELTTKCEIALIFDEVITGFRMHPGGAQALFNIKADMATYGKVLGGGLSIGAIAGKRKFMDVLDGGYWQYGDDSIPEVGITYFAGTFVRHPLALAASKASLIHLKKQGPALQERLNEMTNRLVTELNTEFKNKDLPMIIHHFGSLWRLKFNEDILHGELLFNLLRLKGIHIWDGFPCYLTEPYTEEDVTQIINAFKSSLEKMVSAGFFITSKSESITSKQSNLVNCNSINKPPVDGAKLGRDEEGNPAWFIKDPSNIGEYIKICL